MESEFKKDQVKALIKLRQAAKVLPSDTKKAIKIYLNELDHDKKALIRAINSNDFPMIRHSAYGIEMNSNWILDLIKKYEV
jgi:plasmid maintenance system killer protein